MWNICLTFDILTRQLIYRVLVHILLYGNVSGAACDWLNTGLILKVKRPCNDTWARINVASLPNSILQSVWKWREENWSVTYNNLPSAGTKIEGYYYVPARGKRPVFSLVLRLCGDQRVRSCGFSFWNKAQIRLSWSGHENLFKLMLYRLLGLKYMGKQSSSDLSGLFFICRYHLNNNFCLCLRCNEKNVCLCINIP